MASVPMIEKQEYYHGAAILRLLSDERTCTVRPAGAGFIVNGYIYILIKYATKTISPWRFTFSLSELRSVEEYLRRGDVILALVCGGDGICAIQWSVASQVLGDVPSWMSCQRGFNKRYVVSGPLGEIARRIPHGQWPSVVFGHQGVE